MINQTPTLKPNSRARAAHWLASRRRRTVVSLATLLVIVGIALAVTDPFASARPISVSNAADSEYPTSTATVTRETLSSQTEVSATLGYAGSYTVTIPSGTAASEITQDQETVSADEAKVADDETTLKDANATATPSNDSTLLAAEQTISTDETALSTAKSQLASDEMLSCPASSSATVTTAIGGSSDNSGSGNNGGGNSSGDSESPAGNSGASGNSGTTDSNHAANDASANDSSASAPSVTTGSASGTTNTSTTLAGTIDPNGADTEYSFEYGTTSAFGSTTAPQSAGSGTTSTSFSATITGLKPDTTYDFALVATSSAGTGVGTTGTFQTGASSCVAEKIVIGGDESSLAEAKDALSVDRLGGGSSVTSDAETLSNDKATLAGAQQVLSVAQAQATNPNTTFTALPSAGQVITRGKSVYSLNSDPVPLFYGTTAPYRALYLGVSNGPDVTELNDNLAALGFGSGISGSDQFSAATETAVKAWQRSLGISPTGVVSLGDIVVEPGPIEVDTVPATVGSTAAAGSAGSAVLTATSTTREVTIDLDADEQSDVRVGDAVTVTLPDDSTTPGVVSSVGTVATTPSSSAGNTGTSTPTITVEVTLTDPKVTGDLDEAPVTVSITNATASNVLAVPVDALLALSSGGYGLEEVEANGLHHLVPVTLGLFDDEAGTVQVSGSGLDAGQKIVVPNT